DDEYGEHADRHPVGGLFVDLAEIAAGGQRDVAGRHRGQRQRCLHLRCVHRAASSRIWAVRRSYSLLARRTYSPVMAMVNTITPNAIGMPRVVTPSLIGWARNSLSNAIRPMKP